MVVALWCAVCFDREAREVARQHLRFAVAERGFDFSLPFEPTTRVDLQMADAQTTYNQSKLHALVEAHPRDAALLAVYVRSNNVIPRIQDNRTGPLASTSTAWSVQISYGPDAITATPDGVIPLPASSPKPPNMRPFLNLVARGQKLEPQNSYWDWIEMGALIAESRETELDAIIHSAAQKAVFDDHTGEELRARIAHFKRQKLVFAPGADVEAEASLPLTHISVFYQGSRFMAQRVMGLRLEGRDAQALQLGLDAMHLVRMVRL